MGSFNTTGSSLDGIEDRAALSATEPEEIVESRGKYEAATTTATTTSEKKNIP